MGSGLVGLCIKVVFTRGVIYMSRKGQVHVSRIQKIRQDSHYRLRIEEAM